MPRIEIRVEILINIIRHWGHQCVVDLLMTPKHFLRQRAIFPLQVTHRIENSLHVMLPVFNSDSHKHFTVH